ncbi:MAG TPA: 3-mercaptopyruvate sulfurtransferase [Gemmatimonadales bacterium]|nr:3-mercaptopyruvate sulfurtransferase [Gemmatimonadales bacterium]
MSGPGPALVSTEWLAGRLDRPGLVVLDGSAYLPASGRDPAAEYAAGHIPGAVFFDVDATSDRDSALPHMLPSPEAFAERMAALGIADDDHVVVYDGSGVNLSAPRVWWMFRVMGHDRVSLLDGGLGRWRREGRPLEAGVWRRPPARFTPRPRPGAVRDLDAVRAALESGSEQVVDMRSAGRFAGAEPEPRPGLRGGHMPGSLNLPFDQLVAEDGTLLPPERLRSRIAAAGIDPARPVVATCGSGLSACALIFALHLLGRDDVTLYDGAWTEWGGRPDTPVESGEPA